jgi:NADPH:quinone reductase-like Zn-dependent oxidoreductase
MKAVVALRFGGPDVLRMQEMPLPCPDPGEILVRVRSIGLNFADLFARMGVYPLTPPPPFIPGLEFSGDVVAVGPAVVTFRGRERVMGYSRHGSHAEYLKVRAPLAVTMPASMSYEEGAAFVATSITAYHGLIRLANLRKGERVLIHAAAGGVGLAAIQIARHCGATVFATAGSEEKLAVASKWGADHLINYRTTDFADAVRSLTGGKGVDVIMDSVGGEVFRKGWSLLADMGRYVLFGVASVVGSGALSRVKAAASFAQMRPIFPPSLISQNKGLFAFNLGTLSDADSYLAEAAEEVLSLYNRGALKPVVGRIFPFDQVADAHSFLQTRQSVGKVVINVPL